VSTTRTTTCFGGVDGEAAAGAKAARGAVAVRMLSVSGVQFVLAPP
jgi:hypothetical protein